MLHIVNIKSQLKLFLHFLLQRGYEQTQNEAAGLLCCSELCEGSTPVLPDRTVCYDHELAVLISDFLCYEPKIHRDRLYHLYRKKSQVV
jgi:hypothetical protein